MDAVAGAVVTLAALEFVQASFHFGNLDVMSSFLVGGSFCII